MKLRLRSLETKETLKIEVPTPSSLDHLKDVVSRRVSSSSSSSAPASVHLSLNRKDELLASSPQESLQSLGITPGDLIFFTFNPYGFSSDTLIVQSNSYPQEPNSREFMILEPNSQKESTLGHTLVLNSETQNSESVKTETQELNARKEETQDSDSVKSESEPGQANSHKQLTLDQTLDLNSHDQEALNSESVKTETQELNARREETQDSDSGKSESTTREDQILGLDTQVAESLGLSETEYMEIDDDTAVAEAGKSFSVPSFLRKVFRKEVGEGGGGGHKLPVIAVHAVLLESGFVGFDLVSRTKVEGFYLPDEWPSSAFTMSLWYTLPQINGIQTVLLRFQSLGNFVNIYGSLAENGSNTHRVCFDEEHLVFFLNTMWENCDSVNQMNRISGFSHSCLEREIFGFWKTVKDRIALPLLIDLCEKAGLALPPCFMHLPTDLKLKILESLPGVDVARVGCVCSELRYLSSNDDLWKKMFVEEFGNVEGSEGGGHWKEKFVKSWETRKRRRVATRGRFPRMMEEPSIWGDPDPLRLPRIIGGDYDIRPVFPLGRTTRSATRRNVIPHCNLELRRA